jgi:hypothetical protein
MQEAGGAAGWQGGSLEATFVNIKYQITIRHLDYSAVQHIAAAVVTSAFHTTAGAMCN